MSGIKRMVVLLLVLMIATLGLGIGLTPEEYGVSAQEPSSNRSGAALQSTSSWTLLSPSSSPGIRVAHAMVYLPSRDQLFFTGGYTTNVFYKDAWFFSSTSNNWAATTNLPANRAWHSVVYDSTHDRAILFGGMQDAFYDQKNDTWAYDFTAQSWTDRQPSNPPSNRYGAAMVYSPVADRSILFGGIYGLGGASSFFSETWVYDYTGNAWVNRAPSAEPPSRAGHAMVYDSAHDKVILFGGSFLGGNGSEYLGDTWVYDYATNTWTNKNPANPPHARSNFAMVYDSAHDKTILFGGYYYDTSYKYLADTWVYDYPTNTWTNLGLAPESSPSPRLLQAMAYDSTHQKTILYAGRNQVQGGVYYGDTWSFSLGDLPAPILTITPTSLGFGDTDTTLPFTVANSGAATLNWSATKSDNWITNVVPTSGSLAAGASQVVQVTVSRAGKSPGTYNGLVGLTSNGGATGLPVQMNIPEPPPLLSVTPTSLSFGFSTSTLTFSVANAGGQTLTWSATKAVDWITTLAPVGGSLGAGLSQTVTVSVSRVGKTPGGYTAYIQVSSNVGSATVLVQMGVPEPEPTLSVTPTLLDFGSSLTALPFSVQNAGGGTLSWSASEQVDWITGLSPSAGNLGMGASQTVTVNISRLGKAPGSYMGKVQVASNAGSSEVEVRMTVPEPPPSLEVTPVSLTFPNFDTQKTFRVRNAGGGTLSWSASEDSPWIVGLSPSSGNLGLSASVTVTVDVSRVGMSPGTYSATIPISSNAGSAQVQVQMTVLEPDQVTITNLPAEFTIPFRMPFVFLVVATDRYSYPIQYEILSGPGSIGLTTGLYQWGEPTPVGDLPVVIKATSSGGASDTKTLTLHVLAYPPSVTSQPVGNLTAVSATLHGEANPFGQSTQAWFQWGLSAAYGTTTATQLIGSGASSLLITAGLADLQPATTYHYRLVAQNASGLVYGGDVAFTTPSFILSNLSVTPTAGIASWRPVQFGASGPVAGNWSMHIYNNEWLEVTTYGTLTIQSANPGTLFSASWTPTTSYSLTGTHYAFLEMISGTRSATASLVFSVDNYSTRVTGLQFTDSFGNPILAPSPGVPFRLRVTFRNQLSTPLAQVFVPVLLGSQYAGAGQVNDVQPGQSVDVYIDCAGLPAGSYSLVAFAWGGLAGPPLADPLRQHLTVGSGL